MTYSKVLVDLVAAHVTSLRTAYNLHLMFPDCPYLARILMRLGTCYPSHLGVTIVDDNCGYGCPWIPGYPVAKVVVDDADGWKRIALPKTRHLCLCFASNRESERLVVELQPEHVCCNWLLTPVIPESPYLMSMEFKVPLEGVPLEYIDETIALAFKHWKTHRLIVSSKRLTKVEATEEKQRLLYVGISNRRMFEYYARFPYYIDKYHVMKEILERIDDFYSNVLVKWQ